MFEDTNEKYYWLGLIVTDGHISKTGELKVELAVKDYDYLKNFGDFIGVETHIFPPYKSSKPNSNGTCRVKIKDLVNGVKLREFLSIVDKKTYSPISIDFIKNKNNLLSFLAGYVDGDGTINKNGYIHIDAHINYENFMNNFGNKLKFEKLINKFSIVKYKDMVRLTIGKEDSFYIKQNLLSLSLPIMERKWNRISDTLVKKENYLLENKLKILELRKSGKTYKEICEIIKYKSSGTLCSFIKNNINQ